MKHKKTILLSVITIVGLLLAVTLLQIQNTATQVNQGIHYNSDVCVYINGKLHECKHNTLFNAGKELIEQAVGVGGVGVVKNITLCNASTDGAGCGTPVVAMTEAYTEFASCGFNSTALGTYKSTDVGNWSINRTFYATCNNLIVNVTRLGNATGYFAGVSFTSATLQANDRLDINWTISLS